MKLVFTTAGSDLDAGFAPGFGRAPKFMLLDLDSHHFELIDNQQNIEAAQGAGIQAGKRRTAGGVCCAGSSSFPEFAGGMSGRGGNLQDIVRLGVFLTDMQHFAGFNQIMGEYFTKPYPARAAVQVAGLPRGGMVEAEAAMVSASA